MRYFLLLLLTGYLYTYPAPAQPRPSPVPGIEQRMMEMRTLEKRMQARDKLDTPPPAPVPEISGQMKERILRMRRVDPLLANRYSQFLKEPNTGILKLFPNAECLTNNVVRVSPECASFVPMSSDISFRDLGYVDANYRDLGLSGNEFSATSFFSQGILVALGDVPIESISLQTPAISLLSSFSADASPSGARASSRKFRTGSQQGGWLFSDHVAAQPGTTYALRVIAYKVGNHLPPPSKDSSLNELKFLSLGIDKRSDILIVFRALERDMSGGLTIVWKELSRSEAPTIKFGKNEPMLDFAAPQ